MNKMTYQASKFTKTKGEWEQDEHTIRCKFCGFGTFPLYAFQDGKVAHGEFIPYYCPNCGKKMRED